MYFRTFEDRYYYFGIRYCTVRVHVLYLTKVPRTFVRKYFRAYTYNNDKRLALIYTLYCRLRFRLTWIYLDSTAFPLIHWGSDAGRNSIKSKINIFSYRIVMSARALCNSRSLHLYKRHSSSIDMFRIASVRQQLGQANRPRRGNLPRPRKYHPRARFSEIAAPVSTGTVVL